MGLKEGQHANVLRCDTKERKVGDVVMWKFPEAISVVWGRVTLLIEHGEIHRNFSKCVKKPTVLPTQDAHPLLPLLAVNSSDIAITC